MLLEHSTIYNIRYAGGHLGLVVKGLKMAITRWLKVKLCSSVQRLYLVLSFWLISLVYAKTHITRWNQTGNKENWKKAKPGNLGTRVHSL